MEIREGDEIFWLRFSSLVMSVSFREQKKYVVAALALNPTVLRSEDIYIAIWQLNNNDDPNLTCECIKVLAPWKEASFRKFDKIALSFGVDKYSIFLSGISSSYVFDITDHPSSFSVDEMKLAFLLDNIPSIGDIFSIQELPTTPNIRYLSSTVVCSQFLFITSDSTTIQVRNRRGETVCSFQVPDSAMYGNKVDCRNFKPRSICHAIFADENTIVAAYNNGLIAAWELSERRSLWSHLLSALNVINDDEFISCMSAFSDGQLVLGSNLGRVWTLQVYLDTENCRHICREKSYLSTDSYLRASRTSPDSFQEVNSILSISSPILLPMNGIEERCFVVVSNLLIIAVNIESGSIDSFFALEKLVCSDIPRFSFPFSMASTTYDGKLIIAFSHFERKLFIVPVFKFLSKTNLKVSSLEFDKRSDVYTESVFRIDACDDEAQLSIFPVVGAPDSSPLMFQCDNVPESTNAKGSTVVSKQLSKCSLAQHSSRDSWEAPGKDKAGRLVDQPVTFHTRIKSSGYGQTADAFTKWRHKQQKKRAAVAQRNSSFSVSGEVGKKIRMYPLGLSPPVFHQKYLDWASVGSELGECDVIRSISYNQDGSHIGLASSSSSVVVLRLATIGASSSKASLSSYMGHDGRVTSVSFSHRKFKSGGNLILSSSIDGTVRLWQQGRVDSAALVLSHSTYGSSCGSTQATRTTERNRPFGAEIPCASFFYMDKFIVTAAKGTVYMFSYQTDPNPVLDTGLKSLYSEGQYRRAHSWKLPPQMISSICCVNSINSHLVLAAGSNKNIFALDASEGKVARVISTPHESSVHTIALPSPSIHVQHPANAYNLFSSAARDNTVLIWDLRSAHPIIRFSSHVNRSYDTMYYLITFLAMY
jgi:hypothetical protein